jgi:hypothetical protein
MLVFNLEDGKQVHIDREAVEEKLLLSIFEKFDEARTKDAGMYTILKQAVNMFLTFSKVDIKIPKGENTLEYLVAHYISLGLATLEASPIAVTGKVVETDAQND